MSSQELYNWKRDIRRSLEEKRNTVVAKDHARKNATRTMIRLEGEWCRNGDFPTVREVALFWQSHAARSWGQAPV